MSAAANQFRHVRILFWSPDLASSVSFAEWEGCSETAEKREGLIALLCGKSALNIVSEEYIAAVFHYRGRWSARRSPGRSTVCSECS
jgi:hypothetical protein